MEAMRIFSVPETEWPAPLILQENEKSQGWEARQI